VDACTAARNTFLYVWKCLSFTPTAEGVFTLKQKAWVSRLKDDSWLRIIPVQHRINVLRKLRTLGAVVSFKMQKNGEIGFVAFDLMLSGRSEHEDLSAMP
jgi:hypothetical protein